MARVLIICTGGTIGSGPTQDGLGLQPHERLAPVVAEASARCEATIEVAPWRDAEGRDAPPIDSADSGPTHWSWLARQIISEAPRFDGFVVLHGTDTMAYAGGALAFALRGLPAAVVLTGAQRPPHERRSDASANLALAIDAASGSFGQLSGEVALAFGGRVMLATRASKRSTHELRGFGSDRCPTLSRQASAARNAQALAAWRAGRTHVVGEPWPSFESAVLDMPVAPGLSRRRAESLLSAAAPRGVIFRLFGAGAAPADLELPALANDLAARGVLPVAVSANRRGQLDWARFAGNRAFASSAMVDGGDMTAECAVVKTMWALAGSKDLAEAAALVRANLAGERSST